MDKQYDPNVTPKKQVFSAQIDLKKFEKATDEEKKPVSYTHLTLPTRQQV